MGLPITESEDLAEGLYEHLENIVEMAKLVGVMEISLAQVYQAGKKALLSGDIEKGIKKVGKVGSTGAKLYGSVYNASGNVINKGSKEAAKVVGDARKAVKNDKLGKYLRGKFAGTTSTAKKGMAKVIKSAEKFEKASR